MPPLDNLSAPRERDHYGVREAPPPEDRAEGGWTGILPAVEGPAVGSSVVSVDEDGGVTVSIVQPERPAHRDDFNENLAERPELYSSLGSIGQDVLEGVEADISSRQAWLDNFVEGIDLLALTIQKRSNTKGGKRNTSKITDSTLLETIVKAQAQARGELLGASGPAKVMEIPDATEADDALASDFERDFNLALTKGMPEYVPDLDRGLFSFFYGGNMFRKGYICPIKGRPMISTISTEDMIVSEEATDLDTATRVTHRIPKMAPNEVRRRQYRGIWRDVPLSSGTPNTTPDQQKLSEVAGVRSMSTRPQDQPYCIYSTITDLDLGMYGLDEPGNPDGQPLPYIVTIEEYSRQVLRIERYWREGDPNFNRKRRIVHYSMVPGFGFLAYGFLHLQGNQVKALTAVVRLLIDAMMFSQFPGGVKAKNARTDTNEIDPGPGEWVDVGVPAGTDIRSSLMAFPYKDLSPVAIQFYNLLQQAATRVGAAAMMEVGEGRANIPVGTIMAMLEEKSIVMSAVHKRMHAAMSQELSMLRELFVERPETLARVVPNPSRTWEVAREFADLDLVPASDPNVPSQVHRIMLATALATLLSMPATAPLLDAVDILKRVLRMIGISDVDNLVHAPPQQQQTQDPAVTAAQISANAKALENRRKAATETVEASRKAAKDKLDAETNAEKRASDERIAKMREETERMRMVAEHDRAEASMARTHDKMTLDHLNSAADREADLHKSDQAMQSRQFGGGSF